MVLETMMVITGIILLVLFSILVLVNSLIVASWFKKPVVHGYQPSLSIVIPAYNEEERISQCIKAIKKSDYPKNKYEIIVVDDGSTDKTASIAGKLNAKVIKGKHKGKVEALNTGFKAAKHAYVVTIDADTYVEKDCLKNLADQMKDPSVGASTGTTKVFNKSTPISAFQHLEYSYNNLVRKAFSKLFIDGIWFYGAAACYNKAAMKKIGFMPTGTLTEDMDVLLLLQRHSYRTIHAYDAYSYTVVPSTIKGFFKQRIRWWTGVLQAMRKNRELLKKKKTPPVLFVYFSQWWWSVFSILAIPLFSIQISYWLPYNLYSFQSLFLYFFGWFSFFGPIRVVYMIPEWGLSFYSVFGVLSGIISVTFITIAIKTFKDRIVLRDVIALFFYFPFTLLLNTVIMVSVIKYAFQKKGVFIR